MRRTALLLFTLVIAVCAAPSTAECRRCSATRCVSDSACGAHCQCVFEDGKTNHKGRCLQIGD